MQTIRTAAATVALTIAAIVFAAPANAQLARPSSAAESHSTYVGGNVDIKAQTNALTALVLGDHSVARADQCTVYEDTYVGGNLTMNCKSNAQTALVLGDHSIATAIQGGLGVPKQ